MIQPNLSIFNFKKFLKRIFIPFILIVGGLGFLIQRVIEEKSILHDTTSGQYKINRIINSTYKNEIPMFGSSRMKDMVIPSILGKMYFNYGIEGTGDDVSLFFLNEELKKPKSAPILMNLNLEGLRYDIGDMNKYLYNISNSSVKTLVKKKDKYYFHIPVLKYYGLYIQYLSEYVTGVKHKYRVLTDNGALFLYAASPSSLQDDIKEKSTSKMYFENNQDLLTALITQIKTHPERKFIFTIPPYQLSYFRNFSNEAGALKFFSFLRSFRNVRVLNYSRTIYPDNDFLDINHLNYNGALKFSATLKDTLNKM